MRLSGTRNKTTLSAAYSSSVRTLASVNGRDSKRASGSIGILYTTLHDRRAARATRLPIASAPSTSGWPGAERRPFEQSEDDAAQAKDGERGATPVDPGRSRRVAALVHESQRQHEHDDRERHVQKKHRAPADVFDQPAAAHRADRRRDRAESRPGADRSAALALIERGADDREAPRHEEGGADALQRAADDQSRRATSRCRRASRRP